MFSALLIVILFSAGVGATTEGLEIHDIDIFVNGEKAKLVDEDGGDVVVRSGDIIEVLVEVENTYPFDTRLDFDRVKTLFAINDIDGGLDISDEKRAININAGDEDTLRGNLLIPEGVRPGSYILEIAFRGQDPAGKSFLMRRLINVDVYPEKHDVIIKEILSPSSSSCSIPVSVKIENLGQFDERVDLSISAKGTELDKTVFYISPDEQQQYDFLLSYGKSTKALPIRVDMSYDQSLRTGYTHVDTICPRLNQIPPRHTETDLTPTVEIHQQAVPGSQSGTVFPFTFLVMSFVGMLALLIMFMTIL